MTLQTKVSGLILAGGQAKRMNYNPKGLMLFREKPLLTYTFNAMYPLVDDLWISANQHIQAYQQWQVSVISDQDQTFAGPLAGLLAGMRHACSDTILTAPCDTPFIQTTQLRRLVFEHFEHNAQITVACTGEQIHAVFLVAKTTLSSSLLEFLANGHHKVKDWLSQHQTHYVDFGKETHAFENINTFADLEKFAAILTVNER